MQRFFAEKQSPQGESLPKLTEVDFLKVLAGDKKKMGNNTINFVFIQQLGKVVIEAVTEQEMMSEARRQGWL